MEFRSKEAALALSLTMISVFSAAAAEVRVDVRHDHLIGEGVGALIAADTELTFRENGAGHGWTLAWPDIQQLWVSPEQIKVLTYADVWWKLGGDRERRLIAAPGATFEPLYSALKDRLDQRLVGALDDETVDSLWQAPAKLRHRFGGPEGALVAGRDRIVFRSSEKGESRTWRLADIDNVSSSGPFDLTITTFERSKSDYGDRKAFNFQLKQPLEQSRYNALWRLVNQSKQLGYVHSIQEKQQ